MLDLSHKALYTFSKTHECDTEHPVVMDQVFGAQMQYTANKKKINSLKHRIKKLTDRVHAVSGFKLVKPDFTRIDKISESLTHELFNLFSWNRVTTTIQASWKEYFHMLYEILVHDYNGDHASNVMVARSVIKYHNVLTVPDHIPHEDPMYPVISSISHLFTELKAEHVSMYESLKNVKQHIKDVQTQTTEVQHIIVVLKREQKELEKDNSKYMHIMRWSAQ